MMPMVMLTTVTVTMAAKGMNAPPHCHCGALRRQPGLGFCHSANTRVFFSFILTHDSKCEKFIKDSRNDNPVHFP